MIFEWLIIQGIIERGLIFTAAVIAVYLTSRIIHFDDLTLEGSFGCGGALTAFLLLHNIPIIIALPLVMLCGACIGLATGLLHTQLKLNNLISGIVVATALFSVNLKIAGSHAILSNKTTLFSILPAYLSSYKLIVLIPVVGGLLYIITWFLKTECGFLLQAVGDNPQMLTNLGKNAHVYKITALMLANAVTACGGSLFVQYVGYFSIWAGVGVLIIAIAGLILADTFSASFGINLIIGSIIYQAIIALTFECNVDPEWNKLITAALIVLMIALKQSKVRS